MMTLVRICGQHRRAVERDLIVLGLRWDDLGTSKLTLWELISIVLASPPNTAVYHAETRSGTMTPEQQMLARSMGYQAPEWDSAPEPNPVVDQADPLSEYATATIGNQTVMLDALAPEDLVRKREEVAAKIRASQGKARDQVHTEKYDPFAAGKAARAERLHQMQQQGPELPAHIAGEAEGPSLPAHMGGLQ